MVQLSTNVDSPSWRLRDTIRLPSDIEPFCSSHSPRAKMLKEILGVADDPPARRRWFHDEYFDLFVWQSGGEVTLFQLCYGVDSSDRALVWDKGRGFFHDGPPAPDEVVSRFDDAAVALPEDIRAE